MSPKTAEKPAALLLPKEVAACLRISMATLWRLASNEGLPRPVRVGKRAVRWREADLTRFMEDL